MCDVPTEYRRSLLNHLGHQLTLLYFLWCSNIDPIAELLPCTQLDNLIFKDSSFIPRPSLHHCVSDADNHQFLPNLEKLTTSSTCLGDWSSLFECPRPLLTHLILSCSHIGIESKSPLFDWHNIPEMWPNLQYLAILNTLNLTLDKLKGILILLNKLKEAHLPSKIFNQFVDEQIGIEEIGQQIVDIMCFIKNANPDNVLGMLAFRFFPNEHCPFIPETDP